MGSFAQGAALAKDEKSTKANKGKILKETMIFVFEAVKDAK